MSNKVQITFPPGRLVDGDIYKPNTTDADGKPLVVKSGPNAGQARVDYYFAVAYPKNGTTHWNQTEWGKQLWAVGAGAFPQIHQSPNFAWKITDGDSQVPNTKGRTPASREGFPGHWVVRFGGGYAPRCFRIGANGGFDPMLNEGEIKAGYFVEVAANIEGNGSSQRPGVYINHSMVVFAAYGQQIILGMTPEQAGFGKHALPPGAMTTPPASNMGAPAPQQPSQQQYAPPPVSHALPPQQLQYAPPPQNVQPNHGFVQGPAPTGIPTPPPSMPAPPPAAPAKQMAPGCQYTYEALVQAGYSDQQMIAAGYLLP